MLKGEFAKFLIGSSDAPKYDITWTENENLIDRFPPEILTFKKCSKRVQHVNKNWRTLMRKKID